MPDIDSCHRFYPVPVIVAAEGSFPHLPNAPWVVSKAIAEAIATGNAFTAFNVEIQAEVARLRQSYRCTDEDCSHTVVLWDLPNPLVHQMQFSGRVGRVWKAMYQIRANLLVGCRDQPMLGEGYPLVTLFDDEPSEVAQSEELSEAEWRELLSNGREWRSNQEECRRKTGACGGALEWVRREGRFHPEGSDKDFETAMGLGGGGSLRDAFRLAKLLGLLAQESSFGTNLGNSSIYKGPFQLSEAVVADFNRYNNPDVHWPQDVDGQEDFEIAARVAAWYLAYLLQQLTFRPRPLEDPDEANKFALAAYNGGLGTVQQARRAAAEAGKDPDKWGEVRDFLPGTPEKKREIIDYVRRVRGYERVAAELGCLG